MKKQYKNIRLGIIYFAAFALALASTMSCSKPDLDNNEVIYIQPPMTAQEREARLKAYLQHEYAAGITEVKVEAQQIRIQGRASGDVMLAGIRPEMDVSDYTLDSASLDLHPLTLTEDAFTLMIPRLEESGMDRIYLKWAVVTVSGGRARLVSAAKYATDLSAASEWQYPADPIPTSKKGLKGIAVLEATLADALALGTQHVHVNFLLEDLLALEPGPNTVPFTSGGKTYHINSNSLKNRDAFCHWAAQHNIRVTGKILTRRLEAGDPRRAYFNHPDACAPAGFAMPNLKTRSAVEHYTAAMEFLAQNYSRPDKMNGRIHNWVAHNEIELAWAWNNAGRTLMGSYMDDYMKAMRIIYHATRKFNPHARVFVCFSQFWNRPASAAGNPGLFSIRELLERLALHSAVEGDFDWGIDIHPYAQNLFEMRTWEDSKATYSFDTELITFKNIEVVDAYIQQPHLLYQGQHLRPVIIVEGGFHCPPGDAERERLQSAAIIYAWRKIQPLKSIEVWHYHLHIDSPLHIQPGSGRAFFWGLRSYKPDTILGEKKHSHDIYRILGTADEAAASAFAGSIIGIPLDDIPYRQSIH